MWHWNLVSYNGFDGKCIIATAFVMWAIVITENGLESVMLYGIFDPYEFFWPRFKRFTGLEIRSMMAYMRHYNYVGSIVPQGQHGLQLLQLTYVIIRLFSTSRRQKILGYDSGMSIWNLSNKIKLGTLDLRLVNTIKVSVITVGILDR